jgi:hypothetical protein
MYSVEWGLGEGVLKVVGGGGKYKSRKTKKEG